MTAIQQFTAASIYSPGQIAGIVIIVLILAAAIGLNIYLFVIWRPKIERRLYDETLQAQRDALLSKLEYMRAGGQAETHTWLSYVEPEHGDDDDNAEADTDLADAEIPEEPVIIGEPVDGTDVAPDGSPIRAEVLAVDELSPKVRRKLGLRAKRHNGKKFYVRYKLGFDARLRYSDDETKVRYMELMDDIKSYQGVEIVEGFESCRICVGGNTVALMLFSGKKLCVALALNPAEYKRTKYHGEDKSNTKRFAKTPMFIRISDGSKVSVVKYLFFKLAEANQLLRGDVKEGKYDLAERTREDLIMAGSVRVIILNDAPLTAMTAAELRAAEEAAAATAETPVADEPTVQPEEPVADEPTAQPEEPVADEPTVQPEEPVADEPTVQPEEPATDEPTVQDPIVDASDANTATNNDPNTEGDNE